MKERELPVAGAVAEAVADVEVEGDSEIRDIPQTLNLSLFLFSPTVASVWVRICVGRGGSPCSC